jgi:hypothetical protein
MSKHTPGPWHVITVAVHDKLITSGDRSIASLDHASHDTIEHLSANARLIAAAPALLALAKQYASECAECGGTAVLHSGEGVYHRQSDCDACADIWRVIDQAEGRS